MITVGLVCEGPTDRAVIERMLDGLSGGRTQVNPVQPPDPMRPGVDFGGWQQVFASISRKDVSGALAFNDFVVVQIDTDVCEEPGFSRRDGDRERTKAELAAAVRDRLVAAIRESDPDADLARVAARRSGAPRRWSAATRTPRRGCGGTAWPTRWRRGRRA